MPDPKNTKKSKGGDPVPSKAEVEKMLKAKKKVKMRENADALKAADQKLRGSIDASKMRKKK